MISNDNYFNGSGKMSQLEIKKELSNGVARKD